MVSRVLLRASRFVTSLPVGRRRSAALVVALGVLVSAFGAVASTPPDGSSSARVPLPAGVELSDLPLAGGRGLDELVAAQQEAVEDAEQRRAQLASPEFQARRVESRTAHAGISSAAAVRLAAQEFGSLLGGSRSGLDLEQLARGRQVERFVDDYTVVLAQTSEQPAVLLESPWPVRAVDEGGAKEPVDLSVVEADGTAGFEPENAAAEVSLPADLSAGLDVGPVRLTPSGSAVGEVSGDWVVYPNSELDTDVVLTPLATGAEVFWQLRSPRAAEELSIDLDLPDGAIASETPSGSAVVTKNGKRMTQVSAPMAVDAQGQNVPVKMDVVGARLVLSLSHRDADVAYPILVDPVIEDYWYHPYAGSWADQDPDTLDRLGDWLVGYNGVPYGDYIQRFHCYTPVSCDSYWNNGADPDIEDGLHIYVQPNKAYAAGSYAQWVYRAPGTTSQIADVGLYAYYHPRASSIYPMMFTGIYSNAGTGSWVSLANRTPQEFAGTITHTGGATQPGRQYVVFGMNAASAATLGQWRDGYIGAATIALTDPEAPTVAVPTVYREEPSATPGQPATWVHRPTRWVNGGDAVALRTTASDPGLGLSMTSLTATGINFVDDFQCIGNYEAPCPATMAADESSQLYLDVSKLVEGNNTVNFNVWDALDKHAASSVSVRVDKTRPVVPDPTGSLWTNRETTAGSGTPLLTPGTHAINASASDPVMTSAPTVAGSGIQKLEIKVDGYTEATQTVSESCSSCVPTLSWNYDTAEFGGRHRIDVVATDKAGNQSVRKTWIVNGPARGDLVYPVDGEVTSSKVALRAKANEDNAGDVRFEYRRTPIGAWTTIGTTGAYVTDDRGVPANHQFHELSEPGRQTKKLIWDIRAQMSILVLRQPRCRSARCSAGTELTVVSSRR